MTSVRAAALHPARPSRSHFENRRHGEINCVDPGGFGAVTITKSITIDCHGTIGSYP